MITAGIDMGAKWVKVVLVRDGEVIARGKALTGFEQKASAAKALADALGQAGLSENALDRAVRVERSARTVIDVGAEEGRAIKTTDAGKVVDFAVNEKCAAGSGAFTEAMARALETPVEAIGPLSLQSSQAIPMNAQCAVFAESEVVSLLHARTPKADIARAVHDAIANRIVSMARKVGINEDVVVIGGVARNAGFIDSVARELALTIKVPPDPEFVSALGAALHAAKAREH